MFFHPMRRRHFLRGLGASLLLPYLPSVMKEARAATGRVLRFVQICTPMGSFPARYFPSNDGVVLQGNTGVHARPLSSVGGDISQIIGPDFNGALREKISLVRGCNVLAGSNLHNGSMPTCSSGTFVDNVGNGAPVFPWSLDAVLSQSAEMYPDPTGKQRVVTFAPTTGAWDNFSWWRRNGNIEHLPSTSDTGAMLAKFTQLGTTPLPPAQDPVKVRQADVMDNVFADYKALRDSGRLSAADKSRLEAYVTLIDEAQKGLKVEPPTVSCGKPAQEGEGNLDARHRNQLKLIAAAMICDLTRVASYSISVGYDPLHAAVHSNGVDQLSNAQRGVGGKVAFLLNELNRYDDPQGGKLLDNSLVYFGNEFGELYGSDVHTPRDMLVLLAGGAGGALQTGYYIDYRQSGRRPMNNLMVTMFNAMGLQSSSYQREGVVGFGEYNAGAAQRFGLQGYLSNAERVKPLPFLYKGATLG